MWLFRWSRSRKLGRVLANQEAIMSALEDLTAAVTGMAASVDAAVAALGTVPPNNDAELAALTAQLVDAKGKLDAALAAQVTSAST